MKWIHFPRLEAVALALGLSAFFLMGLSTALHAQSLQVETPTPSVDPAGADPDPLASSR